MKLREFRKINNISQTELGEYLGVGKSFISHCERGYSKLPESKFNTLLNNDKGWDTTMLLEQTPSQNITAHASGHSSAEVRIHESSRGEADLYKMHLEMKDKEISQLKEMLAREQELNNQYWEIIQRLTK